MKNELQLTEKQHLQRQDEFRKAISQLEVVVGSMPGARFENDCAPLKHTFLPGVYVRQMTIPANTVITSKIHKTKHAFFVLTGSLRVVSEKGTIDIVAPYWGVTQPGNKRAAITLEETVWITVHENPDNTQDLKVLEDRLATMTYDDIEVETKEEIS